MDAALTAAGADPTPSSHGVATPEGAASSLSRARHERDEDCAAHLVDGVCTVCGVGHCDACPDCGARGYHRDDCAEVEPGHVYSILCASCEEDERDHLTGTVDVLYAVDGVCGEARVTLHGDYAEVTHDVGAPVDDSDEWLVEAAERALAVTRRDGWRAQVAVNNAGRAEYERTFGAEALERALVLLAAEKRARREAVLARLAAAEAAIGGAA